LVYVSVYVIVPGGEIVDLSALLASLSLAHSPGAAFAAVRSFSAALIAVEARLFMYALPNSPQVIAPIVSVRFSDASPKLPAFSPGIVLGMLTAPSHSPPLGPSGVSLNVPLEALPSHTNARTMRGAAVLGVEAQQHVAAGPGRQRGTRRVGRGRLVELVVDVRVAVDRRAEELHVEELLTADRPQADRPVPDVVLAGRATGHALPTAGFKLLAAQTEDVIALAGLVAEVDPVERRRGEGLPIKRLAWTAVVDEVALDLKAPDAAARCRGLSTDDEAARNVVLPSSAPTGSRLLACSAASSSSRVGEASPGNASRNSRCSR